MMQAEIVKEWIEKGEEDFGFAATSIDYTDHFAQICFHFQRAAEKYLKAFIIADNLEFRPIHNLLELFEICKQKEPSIEEIKEACRYPNPFYIDTRYPVHWPTAYSRETTVKAKELAGKIRKWIKDFVKLQ